MKKLVVACVAVLALAMVVALPVLGAKDVPTPEIISGEVVSLSNYLINGLSGEEGVGSSVFHSEKHGLPIAILDQEKGQLYVVVNKGATSPHAKFVPLMGKMVNARGSIYRRHGVQLIEVLIVAEQ